MAQSWVVRAGTTAIGDVPQLKRVLLSHRSVVEGSEAHFFTPEYDRVIHDPYKLFAMEEAVDRIFAAIKKNEQIVIYGDYDADGISATALLMTVLRDLGASVMPYLPHRIDEGYGLNLSALKALSQEADLIITVDCGVANITEIAWLKKAKVDVIVVDHHEMASELPVARAVLHPRHPQGAYPWKFLCGAGMAWKLSQALLRHKKSAWRDDPDAEKWLLDLAILGTVGDIVSLLDENRAIVKFGLQVLQRTRRPGLRALLSVLKLSADTISSKDVGFKIVPRLNAPGRLEHPQPALDLLLAPDMPRAMEIVAQLERYNTQRQTIARKVLREAEVQVIADAPFVFAFNPAWPAGVVGLAAGQLAQKFNRPAIIIGGNGRHGVGSARSPVGSNVLQILEAGRAHALKLGGHAQAAGFSVAEDKITDFHTALMGFASSLTPTTKAGEEPSLMVEAVIEPSLVSWAVAEMMQSFEPFGEANKRPVLVIRDVPVIAKRLVGKTGNHLKLVLDVPGDVDMIGFGLGEKAEELGDRVDVAGSVSLNFFRGQPRLQFELIDVATAGSVNVKGEVAQEVVGVSH